jgi:ADP-ribosylglycohydrolase
MRIYEEGTKNIWLDGIMGVVVGDALGCPVQFMSRAEIARHPVTKMLGHGTYDMPVGTWTDDSSMALATLVSIRERGEIDLEDIMSRFGEWITEGKYTPFGKAFDIGNGTMKAVLRYLKNNDIRTCGGTTEYDNGNGSLMRIMPACLYCYTRQKAGELTDERAVSLIHGAAGLTHNHLRGQIACGLYYFMVRAVLDSDGDLIRRLQKGLDDGFEFYGRDARNLTELPYYGRLHNLSGFKELPKKKIRSTGYVVDTLEAVLWSLCRSGSFEETLLTGVNLGDDTDTIGAIAGGLAGLYYGYENIPDDWMDVIQRREWVESLCR